MLRNRFRGILLSWMKDRGLIKLFEIEVLVELYIANNNYSQ